MNLTVPRARSRAAKVTTLLLAAALGGCSYALVRGGQVDEVKAERIIVGIQDIRQLRFERPVPMAVKTRDEAEQMMEADLARDYTDEQIEADGVAGALVGLYPAGMDLKAESLKLLKSQVAGFYDPHSKQMVLVNGAVDVGFWDSFAEFVIQRDLVGEMVLAHELTHALQDQHFDLEKKLDAAKSRSDRELAFKCVAEGDASIAGFAYVFGHIDEGVLDSVQDDLANLPQAFAADSKDTPEGLSTPLLFQYSDGVRFVGEAYRRGGWQAIDALYAKPPQSSHQIIHPETYFDRPEPPLDVALKGYEPLPAGWKVADEDTYGELLLGVILKRGLGGNAPEVQLAREWAGDHMVILQRGRAVTVLWLIAFADQPSANRFAAVYVSILDRLLGTTPHALDYRGKAVLIAVGEGARSFATLGPSIWRASTIAAPKTSALQAGTTRSPAKNPATTH